MTRKQFAEDPIFDTEVQISLNGICCIREANGILSDPCLPCIQDNIRCGCVGDFTKVQYDQETGYQNTFTFYREIQLIQDATSETKIWWNGKWEGPNTRDPIQLYGQYFRNTTVDTCALQVICHDDDECSNPPESSMPFMMDSSFYMRNSLVMCKPPKFPGQRNAKKGQAWAEKRAATAAKSKSKRG